MLKEDFKGRLLRTTLLSGVAVAMAATTAPVFAQDAEEEEVEELVITGSRIARRDFSSPSPVSTITSEEFKLTGDINVEQLLNTLPQIVPGLTNTSNNPGTGTTSVDLRGLGTNRTLVLVNGRRFVASSSGGTVDVNNIPAALLERIEVVTGGASSVYGSDAIAGVVNFILKDNFEGVEANVQYQVTEDGDGDTWTANLSIGGNFADGRGNAVAFVGYDYRDPVMQADRKFSIPAIVDSGGTLANGGSYGLPQGGVIEVLDLFDGRGALLGGDFAPDGSLTRFEDPADRFNYAPDNFLQLPLERWNITTLGRFEVNDYVELYMEATFISSRSPQELAPTPAFTTISTATDNPFLAPSAQAIFASQLDPDMDGTAALFLGRRMVEVGPRQVLNNNNSWRAVFGARGEFMDTWNWDFYYLFGRNEGRFELKNDVNLTRFLQAANVTADADGNPVCVDPSGGCVPMNVFGLGNISPEAADFVRLDITTNSDIQEQVVSASVAGEVFELPAGPVGVAFGFEYRAERASIRPDFFQTTGQILGFNQAGPTVGDFDVSEIYGETVIPVISDQPFAEYVGIEAAFRYSDYSTAGTVWSYKFGGEWVVGSGFKIRGLFNRAVRAPNVAELFASGGNNFPAATDFCNSDVAPVTGALRDLCIAQGVPAALIDNGTFRQSNSQIEGRSAGNPNLQEETGDTFTVGAVWQPDFADLSISIDYWQINLTDAVGAFGGGVANTLNLCAASLDNNNAFCQTLQSDTSPGGGVRRSNGQIDFVFTGSANIAALTARGIDLQAEWSTDLEGMGVGGNPASLSVFFLGSRKIENSFKATPLAATIECAGFNGAPCGNTLGGAADPDWKFTSRFTYNSGPFTTSLRYRFTSSTQDARVSEANATGGAFTPPGPGNSDAKNSGFGAQHYFDLSFIYDLTENYTLNMGITNLFDNDPPLSGDASVQANTDPSTFDVLGRRFFFSGTARF